MGRKSRKEEINVYIWLMHFAVHLKVTQHCKLTIPQLKKKKKEILLLDIGWITTPGGKESKKLLHWSSQRVTASCPAVKGEKWLAHLCRKTLSHTSAGSSLVPWRLRLSMQSGLINGDSLLISFLVSYLFHERVVFTVLHINQKP